MDLRRTAGWTAVALAIATGATYSRAQNAAAQNAAAQNVWIENARREEAPRARWQRVPDIIAALGIKAGSVVGDVGSGGGFFTIRLAEVVGETGRVYAVDVDRSELRRLRARVEAERFANVEILEGDPADPKLPAAALDAALIVNAYHEMAEHQAMLEQIRAALKPGGRLVIVEPISPSRRARPREQQVDAHEIGAEFVEADARQAGFRVVKLEDPFLARPDDPGGGEEWLLVLTPAAPPPIRTAQPAASARDDDWRSPELRIAVDEFKRLHATGAVLVLDVRDPESYRMGHLPGALLMTAEELANGGAERLRNETRPIVTYCS